MADGDPTRFDLVEAEQQVPLWRARLGRQSRPSLR